MGPQQEKNIWTKNDVIDKICYENKLHRGTKATSNAINNFFTHKVNKIIECIKKNTDDPMIQFTNHIKTPNNLFQMKTITLSELNTIYGSLKNSNSMS